jgi:hypothetical protein
LNQPVAVPDSIPNQSDSVVLAPRRAVNGKPEREQSTGDSIAESNLAVVESNEQINGFAHWQPMHGVIEKLFL